MNFLKSRNSGFTLIELLVVISIIGLLSSVVLTSLSSARKKAKDASIILSANSIMKSAQIDSLSTLDYSPYYMAIWAGEGESACDNWYGATSNPAGLRAACKSIVRNVGGDNTEITWQNTWGGSYVKYSVMAWLPSKQVFYCIGSNGKTSMITNGDRGMGWAFPGCAGDSSSPGN